MISIRMIMSISLWSVTTLNFIFYFSVAYAQFPTRPIRIVVPLPAGTSPDLFARHIGQKLSTVLKQPVIIQNRPGANSVIGTAFVAKASKDGYTLLNASVQHVMLKPLLGKLEFDPDTDFVPITTLSATEMVLVVSSSSKFNSVTELVNAAKLRPGELNFATPGIGSPAHLAGQAFLSAANINARHIPMKGSTESVVAVAGQQVDYTITAVTNALPLIQASKLRALGTTGSKRHDLTPAVLTMRELIPPGFIYETWQALFAPVGTPHFILQQLNREAVKIINEPDTRDFFERNGSSPRPRTLAASSDFVLSESRRAIELVKAIGATAQ